MTNTRQRKKTKGSVPSRSLTENLSMTDQATRTVRNHILDLTLAPGTTLDERQMLERFEIGRTPMREALNRLIVEGLVVAREPRGVQVAPLNIESTAELFEAYVMSERMVAAALKFGDPNLIEDVERLHEEYVTSLGRPDLLRVTELNARFHARIAAATRNSFIRAYSDKLHNVARRLSYFIFKLEAARDGYVSKLFEKPRQDHERIVDAIRREDRETLTEVLTDHAIFFRTRLARIITEDCNSNLDFRGLSDRNGSP